MRASRFAPMVSSALMFACGGGNGSSVGDPGEGACSDPDGDGWGVGAECLGDDCDETNGAVHAGCGTDCDVDPERTGCPCDVMQPVACFDGDDVVAGRGACRSGLRECRGGAWSGCEGQVLPDDESCNAVDDDCDGEIDDGVLSACGTCEPCEELELGTEDEPWDLDAEGSPGIILENDDLTLDAETLVGKYVWVPNGGDGTLSKIDSDTHVEVARYRLGPGEEGLVGGVSVAIEGDVAVSSSVGEPRVTRVDNHCAEGSTSSGPGDVLEWGQDVCVVWSTELDVASDWDVGMIAWEVRAVPDGVERFLWVGDVSGARVLELTEHGELTGREVDTSPVNPGALAMAPDGHLWTGPRACKLGDLTEIDTGEAEVVRRFWNDDSKYECIAVDAEGKVWMTGGDWGAIVLDPEEESVHTFEDVYAYGVATDQEGYAWLGGEDFLYRVDRETLAMAAFDRGFEGVWDALFLAFDGNGRLWSVSSESTEAHVAEADDPEDLDVAVEDLARPGACGDWTGMQLQNVTAPLGVYRHIFDGCEGEEATAWIALRYDVDAPGGSAVQFAVRTADEPGDLATLDYVPIGIAPTDDSPLDIRGALEDAGIESGALLEVKLTLLAGPGGSRPIVHEIGVQRTCGGLV